jgi:hypothetical protein
MEKSFKTKLENKFRDVELEIHNVQRFSGPGYKARLEIKYYVAHLDKFYRETVDVRRNETYEQAIDMMVNW